jgi:hypothetical protein
MVRKIRIQWEEDDATDDEMDKTSMSKEAMIDHEGTEDEIESEDSEEISRTTEELGRDEPVTQEFDHTEEETEVKEEEEEDYGMEKEESNDEIEDETQDLETLEPVDNIEEEDVIAEAFSKNDVRYAKDLVRNITDYVSNYEKKALASGFRPQGPPRDYPLSIKGQFKRKFRWPVQIRNVINKE